jgi:hypothetical protein
MALTGESSHHWDSFRLKDTDVQRAKRNFPGYDENKYYSLGDMQEWYQYGTTDTDTFTEGSPHRPHGSGYAKIYEKKGSFGRPSEQSNPRAKDNTP